MWRRWRKWRLIPHPQMAASGLGLVRKWAAVSRGGSGWDGKARTQDDDEGDAVGQGKCHAERVELALDCRFTAVHSACVLGLSSASSKTRWAMPGASRGVARERVGDVCEAGGKKKTNADRVQFRAKMDGITSSIACAPCLVLPWRRKMETTFGSPWSNDVSPTELGAASPQPTAAHRSPHSAVTPAARCQCRIPALRFR